MMRSSSDSNPAADCSVLPPTCVPKKKSILRKDALCREETETLLNNSTCREDGDGSLSANDVFILPGNGGGGASGARKRPNARSLSEGSSTGASRQGAHPAALLKPDTSPVSPRRASPVAGRNSHLPLRDIASHMHMQTTRDSNDNPTNLSRT